MLQAVAQRLSAIGGDYDMVCRLGGDEFAVVSDDLNEDTARRLASKLIDQISRTYQLGEQEVKIGTCIGIAISHGTVDADELFKRADLALYEAKAIGPGRASVFKVRMQKQLTEKKSFEADLQTALQNDEMEVYYQPQVATQTRKLCGFEALLRWKHPVRGMCRPACSFRCGTNRPYSFAREMGDGDCMP